ncbi:hypothetical protein ES703_50520 [subsurface metagenome]
MCKNLRLKGIESEKDSLRSIRKVIKRMTGI